jgi:hypothetical protein
VALMREGFAGGAAGVLPGRGRKTATAELFPGVAGNTVTTLLGLSNAYSSAARPGASNTDACGRRERNFEAVS